METILEQQRRIHEERERIIDSMVKETLHTAKSVCQCECESKTQSQTERERQRGYPPPLTLRVRVHPSLALSPTTVSNKL